MDFDDNNIFDNIEVNDEIEKLPTYLSDYNPSLNLNSNEVTTIHRLSEEEVSMILHASNAVVAPTGIQYYVYRITSNLEWMYPTYYTREAFQYSALTKVHGFQLLRDRPLFIVAVPFCGSLFFRGIGYFSGNTRVGRTCNTISSVLAAPMWLSTAVINEIAIPTFSKITGIPVVLNITQTLDTGPRLSSEDISRLSRLCKNSLPSLFKDTILKYWKKKLN